MKNIGMILLCTVFISLKTYSQKTFTLSGYISDNSSGENLVGVTIYVPKLQKGTITNNYGYYSISMPKGQNNILIHYIGYETQNFDIDIKNDQRLDIKLREEKVQLDEVTVKANDEAKKIQNIQMGTEIISMRTVKLAPSFAGEADIFKVIQLMPGIQAQSDGSSGFNVRGGNYDQNLVILDEAVVYNPGHIFGIFSVFNDDAVNTATINKGDMPANYGGRLSSVVDIVAKEGNSNEFHGKGSIGLLLSKLTLEGPIVKDKSSFIISGRRTYLDILAKPLLDASGNTFFFYDLNTKINYKINDKNRLFFSTYLGKDKFILSAEEDRFSWEFPWGNSTATLRWNYLLNNKLFLNTSLIYNNFFRDFTEVQDGYTEKKYSKVSDKTIKTDLNYYSPFNHKFKLGLKETMHKLNNNSGETKNTDIYASEFSGYILDEFSITKKIMINAGLRYTLFQQLGPYNEYAVNKNGENEELLESYNRNEVVQSYHNIEPRLAIRFLINKQTSVKMSYTRNNQYVHLVSSTGSTLPTETWISSTSIIQPQQSTQYALGFFHNFNNSAFQFSTEAYFKELKNQIEYGEDFVPDFTNSSENQYVFGEGTAKGIEFYVKKTKGKLQGWIGYTLSESKRQFDELNSGREYYASNDVRNDISVSGSYILNEKWSFGISFICKNGNPFTIPVSRFFASGEIVDEYDEKNNYRLPDYNRMDISATYKPNKKDKRINGEWVFAIYNVYNRYNPTYIYFADEGSVKDNSFKTEAKSVALIPFLPSVTWRFTF